MGKYMKRRKRGVQRAVHQVVRNEPQESKQENVMQEPVATEPAPRLPRLFHYSRDELVLPIRDVAVMDRGYPNGLWLSLGSAYADWCNYQNPSLFGPKVDFDLDTERILLKEIEQYEAAMVPFETDYPFVYEVALAKTAKVLTLSSMNDFETFATTYGVPDTSNIRRFGDSKDTYTTIILWEKVMNAVDVLLVAPAVPLARLLYGWYAPWQTSQGMVLRGSAVEAITPIAHIDVPYYERFVGEVPTPMPAIRQRYIADRDRLRDEQEAPRAGLRIRI